MASPTPESRMSMSLRSGSHSYLGSWSFLSSFPPDGPARSQNNSALGAVRPPAPNPRGRVETHPHFLLLSIDLSIFTPSAECISPWFSSPPGRGLSALLTVFSRSGLRIPRRVHTGAGGRGRPEVSLFLCLYLSLIALVVCMTANLLLPTSLCYI